MPSPTTVADNVPGLSVNDEIAAFDNVRISEEANAQMIDDLTISPPDFNECLAL